MKTSTIENFKDDAKKALNAYNVSKLETDAESTLEYVPITSDLITLTNGLQGRYPVRDFVKNYLSGKPPSDNVHVVCLNDDDHAVTTVSLMSLYEDIRIMWNTIQARNGNNCDNGVWNGSFCVCPPGFSGPRCQHTTESFCKRTLYLTPRGTLNPCVGLACQTPSCTCYNNFDGVDCSVCKTGKYGNNCDKDRNNTCNGGGEPKDDKVESCVCDAGRAGNWCEFSDAVTCHGNGKVDADGKCTCTDKRVDGKPKFWLAGIKMDGKPSGLYATQKGGSLNMQPREADDVAHPTQKWQLMPNGELSVDGRVLWFDKTKDDPVLYSKQPGPKGAPHRNSAIGWKFESVGGPYPLNKIRAKIPGKEYYLVYNFSTGNLEISTKGEAWATAFLKFDIPDEKCAACKAGWGPRGSCHEKRWTYQHDCYIM